VEEDLWWEGLLKKVCLEFRMEERGGEWMVRVVMMEYVGLVSGMRREEGDWSGCG